MGFWKKAKEIGTSIGRTSGGRIAKIGLAGIGMALGAVGGIILTAAAFALDIAAAGVFAAAAIGLGVLAIWFPTFNAAKFCFNVARSANFWGLFLGAPHEKTLALTQFTIKSTENLMGAGVNFISNEIQAIKANSNTHIRPLDQTRIISNQTLNRNPSNPSSFIF